MTGFYGRKKAMCLQCGGAIAMATGFIHERTYDQEPFTPGIEEPPGGEVVSCLIEVMLYVCVTCGDVQGGHALECVAM